MGFPELFGKTAHFILSNYSYGAVLWIPIHFHVLLINFTPLVAKYLAHKSWTSWWETGPVWTTLLDISE